MCFPQVFPLDPGWIPSSGERLCDEFKTGSAPRIALTSAAQNQSTSFSRLQKWRALDRWQLAPRASSDRLSAVRLQLLTSNKHHSGHSLHRGTNPGICSAIFNLQQARTSRGIKVNHSATERRVLYPLNDYWKDFWIYLLRGVFRGESWCQASALEQKSSANGQRRRKRG